MWILPKQLHSLAFALDTTALVSGSNELSRLCAQFLLVRSKPTQQRIWSRKLNLNSWTALLTGRILKPCLGKSFAELWAQEFSDPGFLANLLAKPENERPRKIRAIFTRSLQTELVLADPQSSFLKTWKESSRQSAKINQEQRMESRYCSMSLEIWKAEVTAARGEYSARKVGIEDMSAEEMQRELINSEDLASK